MSQCPSPACRATISASLSAPPFAYCDDCQQVSFECSCGTMNRGLAQWCRQCGAAVSFWQAEAAWRQRLSLQRGQDYPVLAQYDLTRVRASGLHTLCHYYGYLLLGTRGAGLVVTNAYQPHAEAVLEQFLESEEVLALVPAPTASLPQVLVRTRQVLATLRFLPHLHVQTLYTATHGSLALVLNLPEGICVWESQEDGVTLQILQPDTAQIVHSEALPLVGEMLRGMSLPQGQFLAWTETMAMVYDVRAGHSVWQGQTQAEGMDMAVAPCYDPAQQQVYLGGRQRLWRFPLTGAQQYTFLQVGDTTWQGYQFNRHYRV